MRINISKDSVLVALLAMMPSPSYQDHAIKQDPVLPNTPLPLMKDYSPNLRFFSADYRILDCWQCFEAQGKVCMDRDFKHVNKHVSTTRSGQIFCCKQDYDGEFCGNGNVVGEGDEEFNMICSPPSQVTDPADKWFDVTTGDRNH